VRAFRLLGLTRGFFAVFYFLYCLLVPSELFWLEGLDYYNFFVVLCRKMSKNQAIYGMWAEKSDDEVNKLGEFIELFFFFLLLFNLADL
jgi:hypothetical protein